MYLYMYLNMYMYIYMYLYMLYKMIESFATNCEHCILLSCRRLIFYCRVLTTSHDNQEDMD